MIALDMEGLCSWRQESRLLEVYFSLMFPLCHAGLAEISTGHSGYLCLVRGSPLLITL